MFINANWKTTFEAADIIGVSYITILNWIKKGVFYGVIEEAGYTGRPQQYILAEQVFMAKKLREEDGIKKMRAGMLSKNTMVCDPYEPVDQHNMEIIRRKISDIQDKMIELYGELDALRKLCE